MNSRSGRVFPGRLLSSAFVALSLIGFASHGTAQDHACSTHADSKSTEKPLTDAEIAHRAVIETPVSERKNIYWGDVEFILRCGSQEDAAELFTAVQNTSVRMTGALVVQADQNFIRVSWDDGFNLGAFKFNFDKPLTAIPQVGQKIIISGTYSSYSREPLIINFVNPTWLSQPSGQVVLRAQ